MLATAGGNGVQAAFDIDRGFPYGDPILWLSLLRLYNAQRRPARPGQRLLRPVRPARGRGSTTWLDDYLDAHVQRAPATTTSRSPRGCSRAAPPIGVDYELQHHDREPPDVRPAVRAGAGARERGAATTRRRRPIDLLSFFRFFDPTVGDTWLTGGGGSTG